MLKIKNVIFAGRIIKAPELKKCGNVSIVTFSIKVRPQDNVKCIAFAGLADVIAEYCTKGKLIAIEGHWKNNIHNTEKSFVVNNLQMLDSKKHAEVI